MDWILAAAPTVIAVVLLLAVTVATLVWAGIAEPLAPLWAVLRGALQLVALSLVLSGVIGNPYLVAAALVIMFGAAVVTVHRRIRTARSHLITLALCMSAGVAVPLGFVFAIGAIEFSPRYVLALGGIVIGNTMSIAALAGRAFGQNLAGRWDEVEGWLALGARPTEATRQLARQSAHQALIPSIDQTKTTGLVVLPGAFVGAIFGGASPLEAGRFQIVVLVCILAAGSITAVLLMRNLGAVARKPEPDGSFVARTSRSDAAAAGPKVGFGTGQGQGTGRGPGRDARQDDSRETGADVGGPA